MALSDASGRMAACNHPLSPNFHSKVLWVAAGRESIVEGMGKLFDDMGLRWHGAVHIPDDHGDKRNFHMHLLYHDRGGKVDEHGEWSFDDKKNVVTRARGVRA